MIRILLFPLIMLLLAACTAPEKPEQIKGDSSIKINENELSGGLTEKDSLPQQHTPLGKTDNANYPELIIGEWEFVEAYESNKLLTKKYPGLSQNVVFQLSGIYGVGNDKEGWTTGRYSIKGDELTFVERARIIMLNKNSLIIVFPTFKTVLRDLQITYRRVKNKK